MTVQRLREIPGFSIDRVAALVHDLVSSDRGFRFGDAREVVLKGIDGVQLVYPLAPG